jgi:hypothetical protein
VSVNMRTSYAATVGSGSVAGQIVTSWSRQ